MEVSITGRVVNRNEIIRASLQAATTGKLKELFEKAPELLLIVPVLAGEIEKIIFGEETKED